MKRRSQAFLWTLCFLASGYAIAASKITSIDFKAQDGESVIELTGDGPLTVDKQDNEADRQIVLEIRDAEFAKGADRKLDTSSFNSPVSLISPYKVEGQEGVMRVVVQLRDSAQASMTQEGNKVRLVLAGGSSAGGGDSSEPALSSSDVPPDSAASPAETGTGGAEGAEIGASAEAPKDPAEEGLANFIETRSTKRFRGKAISIQVRDADLLDVFRLISDASGFNIVIAGDVTGKISLSLTDVPWDQALDVILSTKQLGAERNGNVLRVATLQGLTAEKNNELTARRAAEASAPRITRIFPVSYANPMELAALLRGVTGQGGAAAGGGGGMSPGGGGAASAGANGDSIQVDLRTNSLIVQDLPEKVEKARKLVELLDTQTPQVLIEAKVIEASEGFSKVLSGSIGIGGQNSNQFLASFAGANPIDPLIGTPGVFATGESAGENSATGGTFGVSPRLTFLPGVQRLNALLNMGESESQVKVVASPKTVVLNKGQATITQGTPVLIRGTTTVPGVGLVPTETVQSADMSLAVTPTVTNDSNLLLTINLTRAIPFTIDPSHNGIANRNIQTTVVVDSGSTLVIGGIYTMTQETSSSGFPILRKIPILGWLFGGETSRNERSELFFFITPRILNEKDAGLTG